MTDNIQLENIAKKMKINLVGVFSKDKLPPRVRVGAYIINLQDYDDGPGTHWVSMNISFDKKVTYFDSFGLPPPTEVKDFVGQYPVMSNIRHIQHLRSDLCGFYALLFLKTIQQTNNSSKKFDDFLNMFREDKEHNEDIVKRYFALN
jgi:hypothetical protein